MKGPHLRILAVTAAGAAMAIGLTATSASAATAHAVSRAATATPVAARAAAAPATPAPAAAAGKLTSTVTGAFTNADGQGTFAGTFTPRKFSVANGVLEATGLLKGTMTDANGTRIGTVSQTVIMPVNTGATTSGAKANATSQQAVLACNVLDLVLGPLNLNLLGLVVTLNQVHLNITAVPGAGNLLGNLLCAVAGLLNGGGLSGVLGQIASLLNQILALL